MLAEIDAFLPPVMLGVVRNIPTPAPYIGAQLLPKKDTFDLAFSYIKGAQDRPVMASVIAYGTPAPIGGRPGLGQQVVGELPPIKRKEEITEKEILRFVTPRTGTTDQQEAIRGVYARTQRLVLGVEARLEWLRIKALSEDLLVYNEGGVVLGFNYGYNDAYQIDMTTQTNGASTDISADVSTVWSDVNNADWVADLTWLCDKIQEEKGFRPARLVVRPKTKSYMIRNAAARVMLRGTNGPSALLTDQELSALTEHYGLPSVVTYNAMLRQENADGSYTDACPLADGKAILLPGPDVELGNTLYGPTAEAVSAFMGTALASQIPGIYARTYAETGDPEGEWVKAAAVAFPSIPGADFVAQLKLHA